MQPFTLTIADARAALGIGNTKIYELIGDGTLDMIRIGRRRLVTLASIRRLVDGDRFIEGGSR